MLDSMTNVVLMFYRLVYSQSCHAAKHPTQSLNPFISRSVCHAVNRLTLKLNKTDNL